METVGELWTRVETIDRRLDEIENDLSIEPAKGEMDHLDKIRAATYTLIYAASAPDKERTEDFPENPGDGIRHFLEWCNVRARLRAAVEEEAEVARSLLEMPDAQLFTTARACVDYLRYTALPQHPEEQLLRAIFGEKEEPIKMAQLREAMMVHGRIEEKQEHEPYLGLAYLLSLSDAELYPIARDLSPGTDAPNLFNLFDPAVVQFLDDFRASIREDAE